MTQEMRNTLPALRSSAIHSAVSNESFIVLRMTPTGPLLTHPLQYRPTHVDKDCKKFANWNTLPQVDNHEKPLL